VKICEPNKTRRAQKWTLSARASCCPRPTTTTCSQDLPEKLRTYRSSRVVVDSDDPKDFRPFREVERNYVMRVLESVNGNKTQAAGVLGFDRRTPEPQAGEVRRAAAGQRRRGRGRAGSHAVDVEFAGGRAGGRIGTTPDVACGHPRCGRASFTSSLARVSQRLSPHIHDAAGAINPKEECDGYDDRER
jgi:DNA-binding protein Fis